MKKMWLSAVVLLATFALPRTVLASSIVVSVGNTAPTNPFDGGAPLVSGNTYGSAVYTSNFVAPFFTDFCGSESDPFANCDKSWTFNYVIPAGETITAASLTLALADIDSASTGTQVALYQVNGGDVLTGSLNTAAEALNGGTGSVNAEYDVFTFSLASFGALSGGSATVHLTLQGPAAAGLFGTSATNGAYIISSTLNLTTQGSAPPVPEPASLLLMATGLGVGLRSRVRQIFRR
jgi:PEP-CTERM motif